MTNLILLARYRLLLKAGTDKTLQQLLLEKCRRDILFWFQHFCWTYDPRQSTPNLPFMPYPFQESIIQQLCQSIEKGEDLLIEKSRDMGVSWIVLLVFQYFWLFREGSQFHLGSRKADFVDQRGDRSTLFEKLRYNLYWLPSWMRPAGFEPQKHDNAFKLINPVNGNTITGESSNENFARGGRYTGILMDEFPFWPMDATAYASAGQSTPCRIVVGTPYGRHNKFAEIRFKTEENPQKIITAHWKEHPLKTERWYTLQQHRMSEDEIARELEINYHLSVRSRVFSEFNREHIQTIELKPYPRIIRCWDFGYHCPACLFITRDEMNRACVIREVVGNKISLREFAKQVLQLCQEHYPEAVFEDVCDPAGNQKSDKSDKTSIEILNSLGVYPFYQVSRILSGIERIRMKLWEYTSFLEETIEKPKPGLYVDPGCKHLISAFEGGYRYREGQPHELPVEEHPYEDVMDCLRYGILYGWNIPSPPVKRRHRSYQPQNRYTGY